MRPLRHLTPRYIAARIADIAYRKLHPGQPWLTPESVRFLESHLKDTFTGLEFGSCRSTLWFAQRVRHLTSVEHQPAWHQKILRQMTGEGTSNVEYLLRPKETTTSGELPAYIQPVCDLPDASLDFVLVDGAYRDLCALASIPKLKAGGMLIIDDVHRYLPSHSRSPHARTPAQGPYGEIWEQVAELLEAWRVDWTSDGVSDTAIYSSPLPQGGGASSPFC